MKQELQDLRETFPATDAQIKDAARIVVYLAAGLFLLFGMLQAFTGDASAQTSEKEVMLHLNETELKANESVRATLWCMDASGSTCDFQNNPDDPPKISIYSVTNPNDEATDLHCWDFFNLEWQRIEHNDTSSLCELETERRNSSAGDVGNTVFQEAFIAPAPLQADGEIHKNVSVYAYNAEVESNFGSLSNVVRSNADILQLHFDDSNGESAEASFLTASAFQFSGWDESNTVFLLTILILLTFSAYHGLVGCVFACVITVPVPIWNELSSSSFPWGFAAFALLYTVMLIIHIGYEYMGGLKSTSDRGGMF